MFKRKLLCVFYLKIALLKLLGITYNQLFKLLYNFLVNDIIFS